MTLQRILMTIVLVFLPYVSPSQLKVSADSLYLTEQDGTPVLLNGDGGWQIFTHITLTEANTYLADCAAKGLNYLQTQLISDGFGALSPRNIYGVAPFTGANFTTPNEPYFRHADSVINLAATYNIYVMLYPTYLGSNSNEGWQTEIGQASFAAMKSWGQYLGNRYRDFPNILWGMAGDFNPTAYIAKIESTVAGIRQYDTVHLMSTRDEPGTFASTHWPNRTWLTLNGFYPYWGSFDVWRCYQMARTSRATARRQPYVLQEARY